MCSSYHHHGKKKFYKNAAIRGKHQEYTLLANKCVHEEFFFIFVIIVITTRQLHIRLCNQSSNIHNWDYASHLHHCAGVNNITQTKCFPDTLQKKVRDMLLVFQSAIILDRYKCHFNLRL